MLTSVPHTGFLFKDSCTESLLQNGAKRANSDSALQKLSAHTVTPALSITSVALDALRNLADAVTATVVYTIRVAVWLGSFGTASDFAKDANLTSITSGIGCTLGWAAMLPVVPLLSIASCDTALSVIKGMGLVGKAHVAPSGFFSGLKNSDGLQGKVKYLGGNAYKSAASIVNWSTAKIGKKTKYAAAITVGALVADQMQAWWRGQQAVANQTVVKAWENAGWQGVENVKNAGKFLLSPVYSFDSQAVEKKLEEVLKDAEESLTSTPTPTVSITETVTKVVTEPSSNWFWPASIVFG